MVKKEYGIPKYSGSGEMSYLKKYEYAIAVLEHGGISQAAEQLGISQPTFSKYLKKIEGELGVELFDRSALPIKPTSAGECFIAAGKKFLDMDCQLQKQLSEIKSQKNAVVRVGISPSRSPYMMPDILALYQKENPTARVIIEERTTKELNTRLSEGELDLTISLLNDDTECFERVDLFEESVLLAVSGNACSSTATVTEILAASPLINIGKGQAMWQMLNGIVEEMKLPPPLIECQSIESALALVKRGIGAMIVPSYIARKESRDVRFLPLDGLGKAEYKRRVCLFYRKSQFLTQAEKNFIRCVIAAEKTGKEGF